MSSSNGMIVFPTEWKVIKFHGSKPPTRNSLVTHEASTGERFWIGFPANIQAEPSDSIPSHQFLLPGHGGAKAMSESFFKRGVPIYSGFINSGFKGCYMALPTKECGIELLETPILFWGSMTFPHGQHGHLRKTLCLAPFSWTEDNHTSSPYQLGMSGESINEEHTWHLKMARKQQIPRVCLKMEETLGYP